jgi:nucleoside-diphosphate-sugar epimerase
MNIVVTGGSGRIGRYVVKELVEAGHEVTNADWAAPERETSRHIRVDLTDRGNVYEVLAEAHADAVVHLGAWPNPGIVPNTRTYGDNAQSTFNVFQACADMGIMRIVSASTAQVYGFAGAPPVFVPATEDHPLRPLNCYALSKMAGEQAADYFATRYGLTILSFRFMGVRAPAEMDARIEALGRDPALGSRLLWTHTDARDAALACRLAVEREQVASGPFNICGPRVVLAQPTAELIGQYFGADTEIRSELDGHTSPMSHARAEAAFGYEPTFPWSVSERHPEPDQGAAR